MYWDAKSVYLPYLVALAKIIAKDKSPPANLEIGTPQIVHDRPIDNIPMPTFQRHRNIGDPGSHQQRVGKSRDSTTGKPAARRVWRSFAINARWAAMLDRRQSRRISAPSRTTRLSGSGKSSLAFDTLYAEGQRRFVESMSTYARQFLQHSPLLFLHRKNYSFLIDLTSEIRKQLVR